MIKKTVDLRLIKGNDNCNELSDYIYTQTRKAIRIIRPNEKIEQWDDIIVAMIKDANCIIPKEKGDN